MASIQFWLSYNNGAERFRLPVNPPSITINSPFSYEEVSTTHIGEITLFGERGLRDISLSSYFPKKYEPHCEYTDILDPWKTVDMIERWRESKQPIHLTITGTPISMQMTIREFSYEAEKFGASGDIYFTLDLKEYKTVKVRTVLVKNGVATTQSAVLSASGSGTSTTTPAVRPNTAAPVTAGTTHTVVKGDSLWVIAKKYYNDTSLREKIYQANKKTIGNNRNLIYPGMKLVIPPK